MASFKQTENLVFEVGPILGSLAIDANPGKKSWEITLQEDLTEFVQFVEQKNCLVLSSELGFPPPGDRRELYELLLQMNYQWEATGGNRMAINGPDGAVVQAFEIGADGLGATRLSEMIMSFSDAAKAWLAHEGYDRNFGARPLRRTVQRYVENTISKRMLAGDYQDGDTVVVDADTEGLVFTREASQQLEAATAV